MPWRLVVFLVILGFVVFFAGFNIENASDVSFGFYTLSDVPIFISLFIAFLVGVLIMLPFVVGTSKSKQKKHKKKKNQVADDAVLEAIENPPMHENEK